MTSKNAVKTIIETNKFLASHGRLPRGKGKWGFIASAKWNREDYLDFVFWSEFASYSDAKKEARRYFSASGVFVAYVCP